jgi:hypothetical protein
VAEGVSAPETRLRLGGCDLLVMGTIAGFVPDADRVRAAFAAHRPDRIALGVPPEDLDALRVLAEHPERHAELPGLDEMEARFQQLLGRFGATRVPSPDLEALYALAAAAGIPLESLDLDDLAHSHAYTERMKVRHLIRSSARRKKALKNDFAGAPDAYALAAAWDASLESKPMRQVEALREDHMAMRLRVLAAVSNRLLAVVPVVRLAGVVLRLAPQA